MQSSALDCTKHVYRNDAFAELIRDVVRFFTETPVHPLPPSDGFSGTGVYALYYTGPNEWYQRYAALNQRSYDVPIYVGKAVPKGWRQARSVADGRSQELYTRLKEHSRSIAAVDNLSVADFRCRFAIFEQESSDMIGTIEAALIKRCTPLWNSVVDGFGNHDPGSGRYEQAMSDWDVLHPGRAWAQKCKGVSRKRALILEDIRQHSSLLGT